MSLGYGIIALPQCIHYGQAECEPKRGWTAGYFHTCWRL